MRIAPALAVVLLAAGCANPPAIPVGAEMKPPAESALRNGLTGIATLPAVSDSRATLQGSDLADFEAFVQSVQRSVDEGSVTPAEGRALIQRHRRQMEWQARSTARTYAYPDN